MPVLKNTNQWHCPICGRSFSRKNQFHSCELYSIKKHHLAKGSKRIESLFNDFIAELQKLGPILLEPLKTIIAVKKNSQFCSIKIQKESIRLGFRLYSDLKSSKFNRAEKTGNWYYYEFILKNKEQIDDEFISWFQTVYDEN